MLRNVSLVVAGGLVGALTVLLVTGREKPAPTAVAAAPGTRAAAATGSRDAMEERLALLEQRLESMQNRPPPTTPAASSIPPAAEAPEMNIEEAVAKDKHAREELVAAHQREPVDPSWAPGEEAAFTKDLEELSQRGDIKPFTVASVDCRTSKCSAVLEWSSPEGVRSARRRLATAPYHKASCSRAVFFPEPGQEPPYRVSIFFECER